MTTELLMFCCIRGRRSKNPQRFSSKERQIPFKIGDIVYVIVDKSIILEGKVKRISIDKKNNII